MGTGSRKHDIGYENTYGKVSIRKKSTTNQPEKKQVAECASFDRIYSTDWH